MAHHTKDKGDLAVGMVIADLLIHGYSYAPLISEHLPFDLIAVEQVGKFRTRQIQVKYCSLKNDGRITFMLHSSYADKNGSHMKPVDRSTFDTYAIFCPDMKVIYYVKSCEIPQKSAGAFTLRITKPKNNQVKGINFTHNFLGVERIFR